MPEITKTRAQLLERAATELGVLVSGQNFEDEDSDTIENLVDPLVRQLSLDGVVDISDTEQVPSEYFLPLAKLLANVSAPSFGQQENPQVKMEQERILRRLTATRATGETLRALYY